MELALYKIQRGKNPVFADYAFKISIIDAKN